MTLLQPNAKVKVYFVALSRCNVRFKLHANENVTERIIFTRVRAAPRTRKINAEPIFKQNIGKFAAKSL